VKESRDDAVSHAHAALNDPGKLHHLWILSQIGINPSLFFQINDKKGTEVNYFGQKRSN
jgi:hypothetical protein